MTFKGVPRHKLVNETITSKAYQDKIISNIKQQYECTMSQAFNIHMCTMDQGSDIFYLPYYSLDLSPIDTDCSVKHHVGWMSNIKDRQFEKSLSKLVHLEFR